MRICFLLETRDPPRPSRVIVEAAALLEQRGAHVMMSYPEQKLWRLDALRIEADLYLLKSDSELALSLAHALELIGARVINPFDACRKAKDKTVAASLLSRAGIIAPASYASGEPAQLLAQLAQGPIILKPNRGYHGVGIAIAENERALTEAPDYAGTVFAQRYLAHARRDLKLYGIEDQVFAVRKTFSAGSFLAEGTPSPLDPAHEAVARQCAKLFGLSLYGIDLAEMDGEAYVVDVNYFPGYRSVPGAAQRLSDFIWRRCGG